MILFISTNFSFADCTAPTESSFNTCKSNCQNNIACIANCQGEYQDAKDAYNQCVYEEESAANQAATKCTCTKDWSWSISNVTCAAWDTRSTNKNACECIHDRQTVTCEDVTPKTTQAKGNTWTTWWSAWTCTKVMGIECCEEQLVNGQCKLNIYDTLGIRKSVRNTDDATSVGLFVQDIVLSATFFIGTLVTIALVVSGLMFIFAASSGKSPDKAKQWIMGSLIGLLIVVSSYVIIRLVQYIAKGF